MLLNVTVLIVWMASVKRTSCVLSWNDEESIPSTLSLIMWRKLPANTLWDTEVWFNINMSSYQYWKCQCGDNAIITVSNLQKGNSNTVKNASLYWISSELQICLLGALSVAEICCNYGMDEKSHHIKSQDSLDEWCHPSSYVNMY